MTSRQKLSLALFIPVTLLLSVLLAAALALPMPGAASEVTTPHFDVEQAQADAQYLSRTYPERVVGSPESALARAWITSRFTELGLPVGTLPFDVTVASRPRRGVQVWATVTGQSGALLILTAHYDTPPRVNPAYADNAAGLAAMLELARVFSTERPQRTLLFLASDSNAYGPAWGAHSFIQNFSGRVVAVIDLDHQVGRSFSAENAGLQSGYAPLWLRALIPGEAGLNDGIGLTEYLQRALPIHLGDAALYLRAGIPATRLTIGDLSQGGEIETLLRRLDARTVEANAPDGYSLRLNRTRYLPGLGVAVLQLLLFAPLFLAAAMAWQADRPTPDELKPELFAFLAVAIAGLDGYAIAYSLVAARLLPRYESFPATPGDPFLLQPTWWAALAVYGAAALFGWYVFRRGGWGRIADKLNIPSRRTTLLLIFSITVFFAWQLNGYAASLFLGLPAYLWPWIEPRRTLGGRLINTGLALAGLLPFVVSLRFVSGSWEFGPWWWFLTLGAAYGLIPLPAVVGFVVGAALFVRFTRHGWR
jgi:hypothetical protein